MEKTLTKKAVTKISELNKNSIQLRNGFVNVPSGRANNYQMAISVLSELMQFGYMLDKAAIDLLSSASKEDIVAFHNDTISYLKKITGSHKSFRPFWKNFPEDVISKTETELLMHMVVNYWTNGAYEPNDFTKERPTAFEQPKYTVLTAGDEAKFEQIFTDLVSVNQSITPDDMEIVKWFVNSESPLRFPDRIPFKENLCTLAAMGLDVPVGTVTDVLRIAIGMSGGDISLPKVPSAKRKANRYSKALVSNEARDTFKFKKFKRSERKFILRLLEKTNCDAAEAVLKDQRWIRLGEILHPGEYKKNFPKSFAMFHAIRNEKIQSWYGKVYAAFENSFEEGLKVLSQRPGEFVRRMDWLLRKSNVDSVKRKGKNILEKYTTGKSHISKISAEERVDSTLKSFEAIAAKASNKVLYEVYSHFEGRYEKKTDRTIMVKGSRKRTVLPDLPPIEASTIEAVQKIVVKALMSKFAELPAMGKVYVDENLKKIPLPTNMRSLSTALKPTIRGSRIPWDNQESKVIRAFLRFEKDNTGCTIDLSAILIGKKNEIVAWNRQKYGKDVVVHSGDSFGRVGACAEYVDIDVEKAKNEGFHYALIQLHNYNRSRELYENNYFGVMERNFPKANNVWLPSTITNCNIIRVENIVNCAIIDLHTAEYIMVDEDSNKGGWVNMASTLDFKAVEAYVKLPKISVYDLLLMHVQARGGELVDNQTKADTYLSFEDFSQSYVNTLKYMGI